MSQVPMIAPLGYSLMEVHRLSYIQRCIQTLDQEENTRGFYQVLTVMLFLVGCEFLSLVNLTLTHHSLHLYHLLCLFFGVWRFENLCNNNKTVAMLAPTCLTGCATPPPPRMMSTWRWRSSAYPSCIISLYIPLPLPHTHYTHYTIYKTLLSLSFCGQHVPSSLWLYVWNVWSQLYCFLYVN